MTLGLPAGGDPSTPSHNSQTIRVSAHSMRASAIDGYCAENFLMPPHMRANMRCGLAAVPATKKSKGADRGAWAFAQECDQLRCRVGNDDRLHAHLGT